MGWESITATCGHRYNEQMYGPHKGRDSRVKWLSERICPDCLAAERASEAAKAGERAKSSGLPALTGSPKQIVWAEQIRQTALPRIAEALAQARSRIKAGLNAEQATRADRYLEIIEGMGGNASAVWWIDHRNYLQSATIQADAQAALKTELGL